MRENLRDVAVQMNADGTVAINGQILDIPKIKLVKEILPRGSNALMFEALDKTLARIVAVRVLIPKKGDTRDKVEQALAEARKMARLNHENIAQVYSCGQTEHNLTYIVLEFIEGTTLRDHLRTVQPNFMRRVRIWEQVKAAIEYAHSRGIYHGDLHDRNVMLADDTVKIIDFGTSLFSTREKASLRESTTIFHLCKTVFAGCSPRIEDMADIDIRKQRPEAALAAMSAWVRVLQDWDQVLIAHNRKDEDRAVHATHSLAFDICQCPVFSISMVVDQLAKRGISPSVQDYFVSWCVNHAKTFLTESGPNEHKVGIIPGRISTGDRKEDEILLESLWPALRQRLLDWRGEAESHTESSPSENLY